MQFAAETDTGGIGRKIPEGHSNLLQILDPKGVFNKPVENKVKLY